MDNQKKFPQVQKGGSLIIAWQSRGKNILVVGGGEVAAGRILHCLNADASVTVVCPTSGLNPEVQYRVSKGEVEHKARNFEPSDLDHVDMVLVAIDDPEASTRIWKLCKERRIPANIADVPSECDFYFGSVHRDGPLQVMVSTNGKGPRLAASIRKHIADGLPPNAGSAIERIGALRAKLRAIAPDASESPKRMAWMIKVSDKYSLAEICSFTDEDMTKLLDYYPSGDVPSFAQLRPDQEGRDLDKDDLFDGSFGFSVGS